MAYGYNYGGYPAAGGYYAPPMPDQLAQLRGAQMPPMQQPMMGQPVMNQPVQPMQPQQTPAQPVNNSMIWVQGEAGAKSFLVANGNTVPLWDSENQTVYIKTVDASGMPSMRVLDYTERTAAPKVAENAPSAPAVEYVTRADFDALAARYDAIAHELDEIKAKSVMPVKLSRKAQKEDDE